MIALALCCYHCKCFLPSQENDETERVDENSAISDTKPKSSIVNIQGKEGKYRELAAQQGDSMQAGLITPSPGKYDIETMDHKRSVSDWYNTIDVRSETFAASNRSASAVRANKFARKYMSSKLTEQDKRRIEMQKFYSTGI